LRRFFDSSALIPVFFGGAAYDVLIARCAVKAGAEILLTWNLRDLRASVLKLPNS